MIRDSSSTAGGKGDGEKLADVEAHVAPGGPFGSFLNAVRSRKPEDNNANAEVAHHSAALCHLANISYRLGKLTPFDKASQSLGDNKQVVAVAGQPARQLAGHRREAGGNQLPARTEADVRRRQPRSSPARGPMRPTRCYREPTASRSWCRKTSNSRRTLAFLREFAGQARSVCQIDRLNGRSYTAEMNR